MISSLKNARMILPIIIVAVMVNCDLPYHKDIDAHVTLYLTIFNNTDDTVVIKYSRAKHIQSDFFSIIINSDLFSIEKQYSGQNEIEKQYSIQDTIEYKYTESIPCRFYEHTAKSLELYANVFIKDTLYGQYSVFPYDTTYRHLEESEDCRKVTWDTLNIN